MPDRSVWRLIPRDCRDGAWNMAVDEAVLDAVVAGEAPPTLRFYQWEPPCVSIGYSQKVAQFDLSLIRQQGYGFVRRPSGGRSVLHKEELTYCLCVPEDDWRVEGGVIESYKRLSRGFLEGLRLLGAESGMESIAESEKGTSAACFDAPFRHEVTAMGCKVIGSAQWRHRGGVLQHGSIPLGGDVAEVVEYLMLSPQDKSRARELVRRRAATVSQVLGRPVSFVELADALAAGMEVALNLEWRVGSLTDEEVARAEVLVREKYSNEGWNSRA